MLNRSLNIFFNFRLIYSAPQQPQNTLADLQLKLAQLTSNQQPGQTEQPISYQQTEEPMQQTYFLPSQDPIETSQIQHVNIFAVTLFRSKLIFCYVRTSNSPS